MTDRRTPADRTADADGTGSDPDTARGDRKRAHAAPTTNDCDRPPKPMTDEINQTERTNRKATESNRTSNPNRPRRRVKDRDHTSPVDGHARTFERYNEGRRPKTDGGRRRETDDADEESGAVAEGAPTENEQTSSADGRVRRRVKDRDHTSPVDGHKRTFMRGDENDADAK